MAYVRAQSPTENHPHRDARLRRARTIRRRGLLARLAAGGALMCGRRFSDFASRFLITCEALHTTKEAYAFTLTMVVGSVLEAGLPAHVAS
jgi:hypothetical protein